MVDQAIRDLAQLAIGVQDKKRFDSLDEIVAAIRAAEPAIDAASMDTDAARDLVSFARSYRDYMLGRRLMYGSEPLEWLNRCRQWLDTGQAV